MKELFKLWWAFFKLGLMNFGGGYALLPILERELVTKRQWTTLEEITDYYAIGQCTPGPIAVNVSTFIGYKRKGVLGGIFATLGFIAPAFFIIFAIAALLQNFSTNPFVVNALAGIRVCVFALVVYAITKLLKKSLVDIWTILLAIAVALMAIFVDLITLYVYVIFAGVYGFVVSLIKEKKLKAKEQEKEEQPEQKEEIKAEAEEVKEKKKITGANVLFCILGCLFLVLIMLICLSYVLFDNGNTIMFELYFQFCKVGVCAFGGGLATIPFLKELGMTTGWFTPEDLANMIAVSESTPGAIGINMSTYVGYVVGGINGNYLSSFVGSLIATFGLVTPSVVVIQVICLFLTKFKDSKYVKWVFYGLRAASIGLIIAAAYSILCISLFKTDIVSAVNAVSADGFVDWTKAFFDGLINWKNMAVGALFFIGIFKFKKHPIIYIVIAAAIGIILQMGV